MGKGAAIQGDELNRISPGEGGIVRRGDWWYKRGNRTALSTPLLIILPASSAAASKPDSHMSELMLRMWQRYA